MTMHQTGGEDDDQAHAIDVEFENEEELKSQWTAIERLPTFKRITTALFCQRDQERRRVMDVSKLEALDRHLFIHKLINHIENDNLSLLQKIKTRIDKVGIELPTTEVKFKDLFVEAECQIVYGKPIPTLWNAIRNKLSRFICSKQDKKICILKGVTGFVRPKRITLLLGPPGCGKTTLLLALSGRLDPSLKTRGEVSYNGHLFSEFVPEKTSSYVSQNDLHIPELSVRETLDFAGCFQGTGNRLDMMREISTREKLKGIVPDPDIDAYMKAASIEGSKTNLQTDYILKILGLNICADTRVARISGGQKRRLTTGETIVGPIRTLFMDEISNGLDSSTTFQILSCLQQFASVSEATILISLLQPAPETFELFDDVILMGEGKVIYHGPRIHICRFFEDCGFKCPNRKSVAEFLQEVISKKDQEQYWCHIDKPYCYVSIDSFVEKFKNSDLGLQQQEEISKTCDKSQSQKDALCFRKYSLSNWEMLKACSRREFLLMKRNSFVYVFKSGLLILIGFIAMTVYLRTGSTRDALHANYLMGSLFFSLWKLLADGLPELTLTISRISVFCKQKELYFYPAWAYAIPSAILKIPISFLEAFIWTTLTYYVIGYSPEMGRFIRQFLIFFALHLSCISMFRAIAAIFREFVVATTIGTISVVLLSLFGGFIVRKPSMPAWLEWGFWLSPLSYAEIGLTVNEFFAPRWTMTTSENTTSLGEQVLDARGLNFGKQSYWIAFGAVIGFTIFFNIVFALALTFLKTSQRSRVIVSREKKTQSSEKDSKSSPKLPFEPLSFTFQDVRYFIETPQGKKLQLLSDVTGAFKPGVLTALMGVSGAGKTTLLDVLSGRKTRGDIKGEIRVGGYLKVQETFARVSGYCQQFDIHSPNLTVHESLKYSAWLRLPSTINSQTKRAIVKEVLETIELEEIKDFIVGSPGISGLTTEQRKRLTIAVELVSNPSIVFMDEPTTGLDARAAAIVIRAVKNISQTGRTVVCTIHQPGIDIFEAFDELILMKNGGKIIYNGPLGQESSKVIEYFMSIPGVAKMKEKSNPATWILDITCKSSEDKLGVDFADMYKDSTLFMENKMLIEEMISTTTSSGLISSSRFAQTRWEQFNACLWKQNLSYWRNPSYNLTRFIFMCLTCFLSGILFWQKAKEINNQQDVFNIFGSMFTVILFSGINNCSTVLFCVATERNVFYRERFSRMYTSSAYSIAQVLVEIPYSLLQSILYVVIVYPMVGYEWSVYKVFWSFYSILCSLLIFNYFGMLLVVVTPNIHVAFTLRSSFYSIVNLFAGYVIPKPNIPRWWIWMYYLSPTSWVLNGLLTSQYGDMEKEILAFGEKKRVSDFLEDYFGYKYDSLPLVALILVAFPVLLASLFAFFIRKLNFQNK